MREILFRGKRVDNGEWVYGDIHKNIDFSIAHIHPTGERVRSFNVIPETVGQYTGYTDDYAKKIFEGDILRVLSTNCYGNDLCYTLTLYDMTDSVEMERINTANEVKVIGNIHDNPELLEGVQ